MEKATMSSDMSVITVSLTDLLGYFLFYPQSYREQLWPVFDIQRAKRMFKECLR